MRKSNVPHYMLGSLHWRDVLNFGEMVSPTEYIMTNFVSSGGGGFLVPGGIGHFGTLHSPYLPCS